MLSEPCSANFQIQNQAVSFSPRGAWQSVAKWGFGARSAPAEARSAEAISSQNAEFVNLRRGRDSNPRGSCPPNTLAGCPIRPLWHLSNLRHIFRSPHNALAGDGRGGAFVDSTSAIRPLAEADYHLSVCGYDSTFTHIFHARARATAVTVAPVLLSMRVASVRVAPVVVTSSTTMICTLASDDECNSANMPRTFTRRCARESVFCIGIYFVCVSMSVRTSVRSSFGSRAHTRSIWLNPRSRRRRFEIGMGTMYTWALFHICMSASSSSSTSPSNVAKSCVA